jgi:hypothetical protein
MYPFKDLPGWVTMREVDLLRERWVGFVTLADA